jgi:hypothetical protein
LSQEKFHRHRCDGAPTFLQITPNPR